MNDVRDIESAEEGDHDVRDMGGNNLVSQNAQVDQFESRVDAKRIQWNNSTSIANTIPVLDQDAEQRANDPTGWNTDAFCEVNSFGSETEWSNVFNQ